MFLSELSKIENLTGPDSRRKFDHLVTQYDKLYIQKLSPPKPTRFIEKYTSAQNQYKKPSQHQTYSQSAYQGNPLSKTSFIADGKFDTNVQKMAASSNNPYMQQPLSNMDPNSINFMNQNIGFTGSNANWAKPTGYNNPDQKTNILGLNPDQQLNFDVHANSKHYHPKDSEYVAEEMFARPGKGFYGNQQAVKMNVAAPEKPQEYDNPLEAQVMQNRLRQQMGYPMAGPPGPGPQNWDAGNMSLPKYVSFVPLRKYSRCHRSMIYSLTHKLQTPSFRTMPVCRKILR
jgi:hypothetical protein